MTRRPLGELELVVLLAVISLGEQAYGAEVRRDVSARLGRDYSVGAIYASLKRLEDKGQLTSTESDPLPIRGGRSRRYFAATAAGKAAARHSLDVREQMWKGMRQAWRRT